MRICVIGTGYVGLVTGTCFADFGMHVTCVDNDSAKIEALNQGRLPIFEPGLEELVSTNVKAGRLSFSTNLKDGIRDAIVVFIAVGTPPKDDGGADLRYIKEVATTIAENLNNYKVVVTKSTVPVGTGAMVEDIIREKTTEGQGFAVASNPEFLREGSAIEDFMRPDRVVIGARSKKAIDILKELYSPLYLIETPFVITDVETAELIKYASNAFLATKITFINEMATICEAVGANIHMVARGMGLDKRIGSKFLHPGPGYGGSCFPKDTLAITKIARDNALKFKIVETVVEVNEERIDLMLDKILTATGNIKGKVIGALGLAFKPKTDDIRESPAIKIISRLLEAGARLRVFDPEAVDNARGELSGDITYCEDPYETAQGAHALIILTEWNEFRKLDLSRIKGLLKGETVIDLRNIYDPLYMAEMGFTYISVGRR